MTCESGGRWENEDFKDGENPPRVGFPIPQPCKPGDVVTLDGYHTGTGGSVIAGGLGRVPAPPKHNLDPDRFKALCAEGTAPSAKVEMAAPLDYSGMLRYSGTVVCAGASVTINAVRARLVGGYRSKSAGTASCENCHGPISVAGTVPARTDVFEVEMNFVVSRPGGSPVSGRRVGRYLAFWAGENQALCPVGDAESCPV